MTNALIQAYLESRTDLALPAADVDWVRGVRAEGETRLRDVGFPGVGDEDWKYTNTRPIQKQLFTPASPRYNGVGREQLMPWAAAASAMHRAAFVNGQFSSELSELSGLPRGARVMSLAQALAQEPQRLESCLTRLAPPEPNGFVALNTAFLHDGAYVHIESGCCVREPIELLFVTTSDQALAIQPRNFILTESNAQAVVIERYVSLGDGQYLTNAVTELDAAAGARVEHYKLQQESAHAYHVAGLFIRQQNDSQVVSNNVALGGAIARTDINVQLAAPGADCVLNGLYIGNGRQHIDNHTQVDHAQPNCISDEFYKGVLDGRARAVFHGRVVVHPDAQHTDAQQQNKNLLLSHDAEVDTKPQLEIYADDVKCAHGATVGQLDPDALFYLRTRALDERNARSLLTYAFANEVLERFSLGPLRDQLEQELIHKLFHVDHIEELA